MLSTKHTAFQSKVKDNYLGQPVIKPVVTQEYNLKMGPVDHSAHFLSNYQTLKSVKWYRKHIANYLISILVETAQLLRKYMPQIVDNSQPMTDWKIFYL